MIFDKPCALYDDRMSLRMRHSKIPVITPICCVMWHETLYAPILTLSERWDGCEQSCSSYPVLSDTYDTYVLLSMPYFVPILPNFKPNQPSLVYIHKLKK